MNSRYIKRVLGLTLSVPHNHDLTDDNKPCVLISQADFCMRVCYTRMPECLL